MTALYIALGVVCCVITLALALIGLVVVALAGMLLRAIWEGLVEDEGRAV